MLSGIAGIFWFFLQEPLAGKNSDHVNPAVARQATHLKTKFEDKRFELGSNIFLRIVKSRDGSGKDGYLEAFVQSSNGNFEFFKSWDICTWSGNVEPKLKEGDGQSPEGFYYVRPGQMNPNSSYHLSFNLGFPNAYDREHGRTGSYLMAVSYTHLTLPTTPYV